MKMGFEHFFTHTTIWDLLFGQTSASTSEPYMSMFNYKDVKSIEMFGKYFGELFESECSRPLDDARCPFTITQTRGTTDFFPQLREDYAQHFPSLQEMEDRLTKSTLDLMFVRTLSEPMKLYLRNKERMASACDLSLVSAPTNCASSKSTDVFTVLRDKGNGVIEEEIVTIGDRTVIGQKWQLQADVNCSGDVVARIPNGTFVEISKFSRSNNENYVIKEGKSGNVSWKACTAHYSVFVVLEDTTPPLVKSAKEDEQTTP